MPPPALRRPKRPGVWRPPRTSATLEGEILAMKVLRRVACLFVGHRWRIGHNRATQGTEEDCLRCGMHKSTFPGATETNPGEHRSYPEDGIGAPGGGAGFGAVGGCDAKPRIPVS